MRMQNSNETGFLWYSGERSWQKYISDCNIVTHFMSLLLFFSISNLVGGRVGSYISVRWIDVLRYWQKKWDFERQSQHLLRSKWIIFHHLMLSILAKCILWFLVFVPENLTKRIEVFSEATAVQDRILLPFNLFQFQQENQSQCLATLFFCLKSSSICPFFFFETTGRSHQLLQRLTKGASFDQIGLTLQFHRVATHG